MDNINPVIDIGTDILNQKSVTVRPGPCCMCTY